MRISCARPSAGLSPFRRSAVRCDSARCLGYRFQVLDQGPPLLVGQQWPDDAVAARSLLERVPRVRVSDKCRVEQEAAGFSAGVDAYFDRIEVAPDVELLRAL